MTGVHRGVQAIIKHHVPEAVYVHCKAHSLNLAIGHACKEPLVRKMLSTLQKVAFPFDYSAKRLSRIFTPRCFSKRDAKTCKAKNIVRNTMGKSGWFFIHLSDSVVQSLLEDGDGKASGYVCSIKQFDFIIVFCATEHVLSNTVTFSKML